MDPLEQYLSERYWSEDDLLREVRADIEQRGPTIQVSAEAGRLLALLVRAAGATRVLEVGTLFGYSGIWMARELAAGRPHGHDRDREDARRRRRALVRARRPRRPRDGASRRRPRRARDAARAPTTSPSSTPTSDTYPDYIAPLARAVAAGRHRASPTTPSAAGASSRRASTRTWTASARCTTCSAATPISWRPRCRWATGWRSRSRGAEAA